MADISRGRPATQGVRDLLSPGLGRREFIEICLGAGFGLGMVGHLSVGDFLSAPSGEVPIVYGFARDDPDDPDSLRARKKTVPAEWFNDLKRALAIHERLPVAEIPGLAGSFIAPGARGEEATVRAHVTDAGAHETIASLLRDISFDITEIGELPTGGGGDISRTPVRVEDLDDPWVPSGVACTGSDGLGTLAPAMYDPDTDERFFTTSNHLFGKEGTKTTEHRGRPLKLAGEDGRNEIGTVRRGYPGDDFVRVEPVDDYVPRSEIVGPERKRVAGHFTKVGLADLQARGEELRKYGAISRETTGRIKGIDGVTCFTGKICKFGQLKWGTEETMTDGDSGSVSYHADPEHPDEQVLVAGLNNARTWWPGSDYTWGTAAHHIYDEHGYTF